MIRWGHATFHGCHLPGEARGSYALPFQEAPGSSSISLDEMSGASDVGTDRHFVTFYENENALAPPKGPYAARPSGIVAVTTVPSLPGFAAMVNTPPRASARRAMLIRP
jgi:hypothetical protein